MLRHRTFEKELWGRAYYKMLSGNKMYCETHNAVQDAIDELEIMKILGLPVSVYEYGYIFHRI